jgi:hypothetical protein
VEKLPGGEWIQTSEGKEERAADERPHDGGGAAGERSSGTLGECDA